MDTTIQIGKSILDYFHMMATDCETKEYKQICEKEFKAELLRAIKLCNENIEKIEWVNQ